MKRCSLREWIPILPIPVWPLAWQCLLGQNTVAGSMICSFWLCVEACQEEYVGIPIFITSAFHHGSRQRYPVLREDENPGTSTNRARNNAFVYLMAGKLIRAGVRVVAVDGIPAQGISCYTDADINFEWSGSVVNIECKRPQT